VSRDMYMKLREVADERFPEFAHLYDQLQSILAELVTLGITTTLPATQDEKVDLIAVMVALHATFRLVYEDLRDPVIQGSVLNKVVKRLKRENILKE